MPPAALNAKQVQAGFERLPRTPASVARVGAPRQGAGKMGRTVPGPPARATQAARPGEPASACGTATDNWTGIATPMWRAFAGTKSSMEGPSDGAAPACLVRSLLQPESASGTSKNSAGELCIGQFRRCRWQAWGTGVSIIGRPSLGISGDREREPGKRAIDTGMEISLAEVPQSPTSPNHHFLDALPGI